MNNELLIKAVNNGNIIWRKHALERMLERNISRVEVLNTILKGTIIEDYPDDKPFASALFFKIENDRPIHTVISLDEKNEVCYIITAYIPADDIFENDFITRKK